MTIFMVPLAAANELHDLQPRAAGDWRSGPIVRLDNAAIQFHGYARRVEPQRFQQSQNRLAVRNRPDLAVDGHLNLLG